MTMYICFGKRVQVRSTRSNALELPIPLLCHRHFDLRSGEKSFDRRSTAKAAQVIQLRCTILWIYNSTWTILKKQRIYKFAGIYCCSSNCCKVLQILHK